MAAIFSYPERADYNPQSNTRSDPEAWNYPRSSNHENEAAYSSKNLPSRGQTSSRRKVDAMPMTTYNANGHARPPSDPTQKDDGEKLSRNGTPSSNRVPPAYDSSYLSPPKGGKFRPALGSNGSRSGSDADSLLDLYGHPRSVAEGTERSERDVTLEDLYSLGQEDPDNSRWIHRDKLAVIESHEMQEAGIKLPSQKRSKSSLRHKRSHSRNHSATSAKSPEPDVPLTREGSKRQKLRPPVQQKILGDPLDFDLRTPGEIASESLPGSGSSAMYPQPNMARSGSKIPLPKTSPLPISQNHIARNAPLQRSRLSGNWSGGDGDGFSHSRIRSRSNSVGSRILLDDSQINSTPTPALRPGSRDGLTHSPPKQRSAIKPGSVSNARPRTSNGTRNISEPPQLHPSTSTQRSSPGFPRPRSRSGLEPRPATAVNRPEGEAPWIAEMFKPDPRLPPEQQMLPTHAKRLQQEQREREAREAGLQPQQPVPATLTPERPVGITRTPSPMAANNRTQTPQQNTNQNQQSYQNPIQQPYQIQNQQPYQSQVPDIRKERYAPERTNTNSPSGQWPLKVAPPIKPPSIKNPSNRGHSPIISSDQPHGGYSTIPKVQSTPPIGSAPSPKPMSQAMVQEKPKEKKKACGCCVVM